jgi:hypothetical protein
MSRGVKPLLIRSAVLLGCLALVGSSSALAGTSKPATAAQVTKLVAASAKIETENTTIQSLLPNVHNDQWWTTFGTGGEYGCEASTDCTFGDLQAKKTFVVFGDSHAAMWLPPVVWWAVRNKYKVVLVWQPGCPPALFPTSWEYQSEAGTLTPAECATWLTGAISFVLGLKPNFVMVGERSSAILSEPAGVPFTSSQWQLALTPTLKQLKTKTDKVILMEDIPWHTQNMAECLAAEPTDVQACSTAYPNPQWPGQQVAEQKAAKAAKSIFISTTSWFCISNDETCSGIIGNYITYWDQGHVTASYSTYLEGVLGTALTKSLTAR